MIAYLFWRYDRPRGTAAFGRPFQAGSGDDACAEDMADLCQQLHEELGVTLEPGALTALGRFETATANEPGFRLVSEVFLVDLDDDGDEPAPRAEIAELRWVLPASVAGLPEEACEPWAPLLVRVARDLA